MLGSQAPGAYYTPFAGADFSVPAVSPRAALQVGDVWACVRVLADAAASLPLVPYRQTAQGRQRVDGTLGALLDRPSPGATQANLTSTIVAHLNLWGNAYLGKLYDDAGAVVSLWPLPPERVIPRLVAGEPRYMYTPINQAEQELTLKDLVHIRAMSTDGLVGLSPIRQCSTAIALATGIGTYNLGFFDHGAHPSGFLNVDGHVSRDHLEALRAGVNANHGGARNAHKIAVMDGAVTWTPITGPADEMQFIERADLSTREIARIFRVPPHLIGASSGESMHYSNVESQSLEFVQYSLRPHLVAIEQAITADADLCRGSLYVEFLLDALLRADSATRAGVYTQALAGGWLTVDEIRQRENLPPLPTAAPTIATGPTLVTLPEEQESA